MLLNPQLDDKKRTIDSHPYRHDDYLDDDVARRLAEQGSITFTLALKHGRPLLNGSLSDPGHRLRRLRQIRSTGRRSQTMGKVIASATVSLDGFIADESDGVGPLFDWYQNGDVPFNGGDPERVFHVSAASAAYMEETWSQVGTAVIGRRLFDITNGWNGRPAAGDAVFVVTHRPPTDWPFPDAPFTFVTDGLASAIARAKAAAGDKDVSLTGGDLLGQALAAGLVDELQVDLVPVVFGKGVRFFGAYDGPPALLGNPKIVQGDRVTHLRYDVRR